MDSTVTAVGEPGRPDGRIPAQPDLDDRGSALLLFPAGMLILLVLAALSFDLSLAFQRKRQLIELADAATNDAVTFGLDDTRLRADGSYCLDPGRVARSIEATLSVTDLDVTSAQIRLVTSPGAPCPTGVTVILRSTSDYPFGQAVPGMSPRIELSASSEARAVIR